LKGDVPVEASYRPRRTSPATIGAADLNGDDPVRATEVRADPVMVLSDRALTDLLRARRMLEETEGRLVEALGILRTLEEPSPIGAVDHASWAGRLDEAIRHLGHVRTILRALLSEERP
jgi:hypothetical protein